MQQFIKKHESRVLGVLNGFDRIRFRGTLRVLSVVQGLFAWMNQQQVLLKQFGKFSADLTKRLKASVQGVARSAKTGRLLRLFRDHHLIYRVKGTHRYQLTAHGRRTLPSLLTIRTTNSKKLRELAM